MLSLGLEPCGLVNITVRDYAAKNLVYFPTSPNYYFCTVCGNRRSVVYLAGLDSASAEYRSSDIIQLLQRETHFSRDMAPAWNSMEVNPADY